MTVQNEPLLKDMSLLKKAGYINGQWVNAKNGKTFDVINPASGDVIASVADLGKDEAKTAVIAAENAFLDWRKITAKQRAILLRRWNDLILENQEDLARLMTFEQGKVIMESRLEIAYAASFIEWFAEEGKRMNGDIIPAVANDRRQLSIKQPIGVVGAITPWNFPSAMITRKCAPAFAAGCSFVCKPAAETPLSALALCELAERAGLPPGLLNVIPSTQAQEVGDVLTKDPIVKKFTFTGSTPVGKHLLAQCASTVKKASMELGGNAPVIIFEDADLEKAVLGALGSKYRNAGQTCICANRILVQENIYNDFLKAFTEKVSEFILGDGLNENNTMGPVISEQAVHKIQALVDDAKAKGATIVTGGAQTQGQFFSPTIIADVTEDMRLFSEEIFGPVAPVFTFKTEEDAIKMANDTPFGLAAYFYSRDIGRVWRVSEALDYGMIGANEVGITSEVIPFGGWKESGLGREGSACGIDEYLEIKYICMGGL
ncbi:NAD-dependent succinate-semialdehyde dehydrogenase [Temperatibacter marinus]|uniref:NAD-dependent succinate-semialdehyde dehydrogenase n=1 Tax=Temperatibacter marinus TaxID=1456591 RepID=A0AA52EIH9_9PROT|nr:NAD-dependent succinate-semialdehyde dehydrogenase [Temperatibacter marinus]WND03162.1 NAD-dependent succinate-semialdehyde dehydrogenase [Temperatibacter marinus]